jgi:hypothetical protein
MTSLTSALLMQMTYRVTVLQPDIVVDPTVMALESYYIDDPAKLTA